MNNKVAVIAVICVLIVAGGAGAAFFMMNKDKGGDDLSAWDGAHIANYGMFTQIGAGTTVNGAAATANVLSPAGVGYGADAESEYKLVGITGSGECEVIKFVDKDGNTVEQSAHLIRFIYEGAYSLATFSTTSTEYVNQRFASTYTSHILPDAGPLDWIDGDGFIIDNKTGNMYSAKIFVEKIKEKYDVHTCYLSADMEKVYLECVGADRILMQLEFTDKELQASVVLDREQYGNFYPDNHSPSLFTSDRFGNIFNTKSFDIYSGTKVMRPDHTFTNLTEADSRYDVEHYRYSYQLAFNNILYVRAYHLIGSELAYAAYLDSSGVFVDIPNGDDAKYIESYRLLSCDATMSVLICPNGREQHAGVDYVFGYVAKYHADTPWVYSVTKVYIAPCSDFDTRFHNLVDNAASKGNHLYAFSGTDFYDVDVAAIDPVVSHITSPHELKTMKLDSNVDCIKFTAVLQSTQQTVEGYIDTSKSGVQQLVFEPYVLKYGDKTIISITPVNA